MDVAQEDVFVAVDRCEEGPEQNHRIGGAKQEDQNGADGPYGDEPGYGSRNAALILGMEFSLI
jgi:hypothetical protein